MADRRMPGVWWRRRAPALGAALAAAWLAAWLAGFAVHTAYVATATLQFQIPPVSTAVEGGDPLSTAILEVPTYARLAQGGPVLAAALRDAGIGGDPAAWAANVVPRAIPNTNLLELQVYDADPGRAARLANSVATALIAATEQTRQATVAAALADLKGQIAAADATTGGLTARLAQAPGASERGLLEARLAGTAALAAQLRGAYAYYDSHARLNTQQPLLRLAEAATPPREGVASASWLTMLLVGAVALVLALGALLALDRLDTRLRTVEDLRSALGLPVLGTIPPRSPPRRWGGRAG